MKLHEWRKKTSVFFLIITGIEPVWTVAVATSKTLKDYSGKQGKHLLKQMLSFLAVLPD